MSNSSQTNVKSVLITAQLFLPTANPSGASMLAVTAGGVVLPPQHVAGLSAYMTSKTAQIKLMEWLSIENPTLFTCSVQPGVVDTKMLRDSGLAGLPMDTGEFIGSSFQIDRINIVLIGSSAIASTFPGVAVTAKGKISEWSISLGELGCR